VKKAAVGLAVVALLFVVAGCPGQQKVADLEKQVADHQMKITELEGQVQTLTVARDSLQKLVTEMAQPEQGKPPRKGSGGSTGGGTGGGETGKPERTGR
jgi:outer membrane murein-binding lipoprotein Lpp